MNNTKPIINNMKLTELCRQNKIALTAVPFRLHPHLSVYFFPKKMYQNRRWKKTNVQFAGENETPFLSLKTTSLYFLKHCAISEKKKYVHENLYVFYSFYIKITYYWIRWSLTWPFSSPQQTLFYYFTNIYISLWGKRGEIITLIYYIISVQIKASVKFVI